MTRALLSDGRCHGILGELLKKRLELGKRVYMHLSGLQVVQAHGGHSVHVDHHLGKNYKHSRA